jgi:hypothetical protein
MRRFADHAAASRGEWGGAPIPVSHVRLVMEPRYPFRGLHNMKLDDRPAPEPTGPKIELLNDWYCFPRHAQIHLGRVDGKPTAFMDPSGSGRRLLYWLNTLGVAAAEVWTVEAEANAIEKLKGLVTAQAFKCYMLAGCFLETSKRSQVTYLFRKLRPTLAMRPGEDDNMRVLTCLCLHPLGFYEESWAGVMTPTDDVIAHLLLMRGDEHRFWRKANHHDIGRASSGI